MAHKLTADQVLYWSRNPDLLEELLTKIGRIQFLKEERKTKILPLLEGVKTRDIFSRGGPFRGRGYHSNRVSLQEEYQATPMVEAFVCTIGAPLTPGEMQTCIAKDYILKETLWTPQQIRWVAKEQNKKGLGDLLVFNRTNYFPMQDKKGKIVFCALQWNEELSFSDNPKNKWNFYFRAQADDYETQKREFLGEGSQVVLLRECTI